MRIRSVSGIAGHGDSRLIRPVPDAETLPFIYFKLFLYQLNQNNFINQLHNIQSFFHTNLSKEKLNKSTVGRFSSSIWRFGDVDYRSWYPYKFVVFTPSLSTKYVLYDVMP